VNSIIASYYPMFEMYSSLRSQLMQQITDNDLRFQPTERNTTLGSLCREIGEVQQAYIQSFRTWKQDFSYRHPDPTIEGSVERLTAWYTELDGELKATIEGLSEEDIQQQVVDRGPDFKLPAQYNLDVYKEALLIFYGKASVYLHALGKLPEQWRDWIG
jgi:hypothetical protein